MSTKESSKKLTRLQPRSGEGYPVEIQKTAAGKGIASGNVDVSSLPVPDRRYVADAVGIKLAQDNVRLLFGQASPVDDSWLSILVINMPFESIKQLLGTLDAKFREEYATYASGLISPEITEFSKKPDQTVVLTASMVYAGYSGTNGCIDFYYSSPFATQNMSFTNRLMVEPVARVNLPTGLVFALFNGLESILDKLPKLTTDC